MACYRWQDHQPGAPCEACGATAGPRHPNTAIAAPPPYGRTVFGISVWLIPGRPSEHLTWGGEYDMVRRTTGGRTTGGVEFAGAPAQPVSGRCTTLAEACAAVAAWLERNPA